MRTKQARRTGLFRSLFFLTVLGLAAGVASAQSVKGGPIEQSPNAHSKLLGGGWECDRGYQEVDQSCVAIQVPTNAGLNYFGNGWECNRGYWQVNEGCIILEVPTNAFLDSSGSRCNRGYWQIGQWCVVVQVPANAHVDFSGHDWECDPGYRLYRGTCIVDDE